MITSADLTADLRTENKIFFNKFCLASKQEITFYNYDEVIPLELEEYKNSKVLM